MQKWERRLVALLATGLLAALVLLAGTSAAYRRHQPKPSDLPASTPTDRPQSAGDKDLDRKVRICRGC